MTEHPTHERGTLVAVHPDDATWLLRFQAGLYGAKVKESELVERGRGYVIDLDKLLELPERSF